MVFFLYITYMNADIIELAEYLARNTPDSLVAKAVVNKEVEAEIVELNTDQLDQFEDSEERKLADIGGEYTKTTQELKGAGPREVNLNDTGEMWESFEINPIKGGFEIEADTFKEGVDLRIRWGEKIEGLNRENLEKANGIIEKEIWRQAEKNI